MSDEQWEYKPGCPCDRCEDYKMENGLTCRWGLKSWRPPSEERPHRD